MDSFNSLFDSQFIYALGWTIVHSFWQSLLVFTLLSVSLLLSKRSRPETRYGLSIVALVCCLLISVKTFVYCYQDVSQASYLPNYKPH
jgi:bla regulator protein BlaR1